MSRFEEKKEEPAPRKERFQSALDAPAPELSKQAKSARVRSISRVAAQVAGEPKDRRSIPQIKAGDTDEERELKRKIQAKEQEIMDMAAKLNGIAERLDSIVGLFHASIVEISAEAAPVAMSSGDRAKAFDATVEKKAQAAQEVTTSKSTAASGGGTSLEAILAAARGGGGKTRVKSETPKYSKLLRDLK